MLEANYLTAKRFVNEFKMIGKYFNNKKKTNEILFNREKKMIFEV